MSSCYCGRAACECKDLEESKDEKGITKEDLDLLESLISDASSYYEQYTFYDHCSPGQLDEARDKASKGMYVIYKLREMLEGE